MRDVALFAGAGGGVLASLLLGHRVTMLVEKDSSMSEIPGRHRSVATSSKTGAGWNNATALRRDGREHFWAAWSGVSCCGLARDPEFTVTRHVREPNQRKICAVCRRLLQISWSTRGRGRAAVAGGEGVE